jgi:exonuclease VII small subunit
MSDDENNNPWYIFTTKVNNLEKFLEAFVAIQDEIKERVAALEESTINRLKTRKIKEIKKLGDNWSRIICEDGFIFTMKDEHLNFSSGDTISFEDEQCGVEGCNPLKTLESKVNIINNIDTASLKAYEIGDDLKKLEERLNKAEYKLNRIVIDDKSETSQVSLFNIIRRQNDIMGRLKSLESKLRRIDTALKTYNIGMHFAELEERIANLESKELKSMQYSCQCIDDYQKMKNEEMEKGVAPQQDGALDKCDCDYCQDGTPPYKEEPPPTSEKKRLPKCQIFYQECESWTARYGYCSFLTCPEQEDYLGEIPAWFGDFFKEFKIAISACSIELFSVRMNKLDEKYKDKIEMFRNKDDENEE